MAEFAQFRTGDAVAQFRLVSEREQGFLAAGLSARLCDGERLLRKQIGAFAFPGRTGEGAVVADVAAQLRERNEDLARIGQCGAMSRVATPASGGDQRGLVRQLDETESLLARQAVIHGKARQKFARIRHGGVSSKNCVGAKSVVRPTLRRQAIVLMPEPDFAEMGPRARSAGSSMSWPAPSSGMTAGRRSRASAQCRAKLSGPKAGAITSGGDNPRMLVPPSRVAGASTTAVCSSAASTS